MNLNFSHGMDYLINAQVYISPVRDYKSLARDGHCPSYTSTRKAERCILARHSWFFSEILVPLKHIIYILWNKLKSIIYTLLDKDGTPLSHVGSIFHLTSWNKQKKTIACNISLRWKSVNIWGKDAECISLNRSGKTKWYWLGMCFRLVCRPISARASDDHMWDSFDGYHVDRYDVGYAKDECKGANVITREMPRNRWHCMSPHKLMATERGTKNQEHQDILSSWFF